MKKNPQNPVPGPIESGLPAAICRRTGIKSQIYGQIYDTSVLDSLLEKVFKTAFGLPPLLHYRLLLRKEECSNTNTKNTNTKTTTGGPCFCLHYNDAAVSEGGVLNLGIKEKCPGKGASSQPNLWSTTIPRHHLSSYEYKYKYKYGCLILYTIYLTISPWEGEGR